MLQISNRIYCDDFIATLKCDSRLMPSPYHDTPFLIIREFLPASLCLEIAAALRDASDAEAARVKSTLLSSVVDPSVDESIRKTMIHTLPEVYAAAYDTAFKAHQRRIEEFFHIALTTATTVQGLEYTKGSFYVKHADDSNELVNDAGETVGYVQVAPQRKITTVLFATPWSETPGPLSFSGGELLFNYLCDADGHTVTLRPEAGDMVVFPSNPLFAHEVLPVQEGYRLTLVQWHNGILA